jgi:hypothetical protein
VLAVGAAVVLLRAAPWGLRAAGAVAGVGLVVLGSTQVLSWGARLVNADPLPLDHLRMIGQVGEQTRPGAIIGTRMSPELLAWYADRFIVSADVRGITKLERQGVRLDAALHRARETAWVRKALQAQGLADRFVPMPVGIGWWLWLRPEAASRPSRPWSPPQPPSRSP